MKKILLAIDAIHPDKYALDFACFLGRLTKSPVTGIFLENEVAEERPIIKQMHGLLYVSREIDRSSPAYREKQALIEKNIAWFKDATCNREVSCQLHRDHGLPAKELIKESRFADVLVVDAETSFNRQYEGMPTEFVKDVLKKAECPVIISPGGQFESIEEIVLAFDGTASSVFAIRQFTYLFPQLHTKKLTILHFSKKGEPNNTDKEKLDNWLKAYYDYVGYEEKKGDAETGLYEALYNKPNILLVMGAYGRNAISTLLKPSPANLLIRILPHPIFITHL